MGYLESTYLTDLSFGGYVKNICTIKCSSSNSRCCPNDGLLSFYTVLFCISEHAACSFGVSETSTLTKFSHPETESHQNKHYPTQRKKVHMTKIWTLGLLSSYLFSNDAYSEHGRKQLLSQKITSVCQCNSSHGMIYIMSTMRLLSTHQRETSSYIMGVIQVTSKTSQSLTVRMNLTVILHFLHKHIVCMILECLRHRNVNKLAHTHFYIAPLQKLPQ